MPDSLRENNLPTRRPEMNLPHSLLGVDKDKLRERLQRYDAVNLDARAVIHGTLLSSLFMGSDAVSRGAKQWLVDITLIEIAVLHTFAAQGVPVRVSLDHGQAKSPSGPLVTRHGEQTMVNLVTKSLSDELKPALSALIQAYVAAGYMDLSAANFTLRGATGTGTYLDAAVFTKNANAIKALMGAGARIEDCPSSDLEIRTSSGSVVVSKGDYESILDLASTPGDSQPLRSAIEEGRRIQAAQAMNEVIDAAAVHCPREHHAAATPLRRRGI